MEATGGSAIGEVEDPGVRGEAGAGTGIQTERGHACRRSPGGVGQRPPAPPGWPG